MKRLVIEKFIADIHQETIKVPLIFLKIFNMMLPEKGNSLLADNLFNLKEIIEAGERDVNFKKIVYATEKGVDKTIVLSIAGRFNKEVKK